MKRYLYKFIIPIFVVSFFYNCSIPGPDAPQPGVVISWDIEDYEALENWYNLREQIQTLEVPLTFYVRSPSLLTSEQADMLKSLELDGHEIGFHSRFHEDALNYIFVQGHTIEEYVNYDIIPGIEDFANNNIIVKNFAYPLAHHFTELDNYLLDNCFDSLRSVSPIIDWCYYKCNMNRVVSAYWIDDLEIVQEESLFKDVCGAMRKAKRKRYILNLYGHNINPATKEYSTSLKKLEKIIQYAKDLDLEFYRMEDLFSNR